jgi:hypothetical protein
LKQQLHGYGGRSECVAEIHPCSRFPGRVPWTRRRQPLCLGLCESVVNLRALGLLFTCDSTRLSHRRARLAVDEHTAGAGRVQKISQAKHLQTYSPTYPRHPATATTASLTYHRAHYHTPRSLCIAFLVHFTSTGLLFSRLIHRADPWQNTI